MGIHDILVALKWYRRVVEGYNDFDFFGGEIHPSHLDLYNAKGRKYIKYLPILMLKPPVIQIHIHFIP